VLDRKPPQNARYDLKNRTSDLWGLELEVSCMLCDHDPVSTTKLGSTCVLARCWLEEDNIVIKDFYL
jgi:hypothetical protein